MIYSTSCLLVRIVLKMLYYFNINDHKNKKVEIIVKKITKTLTEPYICVLLYSIGLCLKFEVQ